MAQGSSKKSLAAKLGIKEGARIVLLNPPKQYEKTLGSLPDGVVAVKQLRGQMGFMQYFTTSSKDLEQAFPRLKKHLSSDGMLWISWPKGSSGVDTDLNENVVMEIGLANGLVDVKVAAIDAAWSGLKFVYRLKDRKL